MFVLKEALHPYIMRLFDIFDDDNYFYLVNEQMKGGDLKK